MKRTLLLLCLCFVMLGTLSAQQITLHGSVKDTKNIPLIGVSVVVKETNQGTITDADGQFSLSVEDGAKLQLSYIGYKTLTVSTYGKSVIDVVMAEEAVEMDDVVVIGYGSARRSDLSGAVASFNTDQATLGAPSDITQGLVGKVAGVNVMQNDGAPGAGMSINVRGVNSFSTSSQPLYILDGVPYDNTDMPSGDTNEGNVQSDSPLSLINPSDIASIEVLKDASATAIYGSRGANGVVLITTKQGTKGRDNIEFSASFSLSQVTKKLDYLDGYEYATYCNEQVENNNYYYGKSDALPYSGTWSSDGTYSPLPEDFLNPGTYVDASGYYSDTVGTANWQDIIFTNSYKQEYNIRFSGGTDKGTYMISGNYLSQDGVIKNSGFTRYTLRSNITRNVRDWLKLGTNINFSNSLTNVAKTTTSSGSGVLRSALIYPTTYDPYVENSEVSDELSWLSGNPYTFINNTIDDLTSINISASSFVEIKLNKRLKFRQNLGINNITKQRFTYYGHDTKEGMNCDGMASQSDNYRTAYTYESLLTWNKNYRNNMHRFNVVGGFTAETATYGNKSMSATNFPTDITGAYDMGSGLVQKNLVSGYGSNSLVSTLARANYTLLDKYIFTSTFRLDGSSKFTTENKYATFYSGAFAWRLSEEDYIKDLDIFSNLKLRLSVGETGNQGIASYRTFTDMDTSNYPFGGSLTSGTAMADNLASSDLRWETTRQYNAGLDIGVLSSLLTLTIDYYYKDTRDLLQTVLIPNSTGYSSMLVNSGNVSNEGFEFSFALNDIFRGSEWKWNVSGNIGFNKNVISGLPSDQFATRLFYGADNIFIQRNGMPIGAIYGYIEDGFYDNIAEVKADPQYSEYSDADALAMVGEIKYLDIDGNGAITSSDMTIIGDVNPDFTYGLTSSLSWKTFTLSLFFQGSQGNDIFNANLIDMDMGKTKNISQAAYDGRWTEENAENATYPKAITESTRDMLTSDRFVEDGSYLK
ncbi:MAG: TonB-dependent receptor, partial [Rikenellaceae bacterium]